MGEYIYRAMEARMKRIFKYIISQTLNIYRNKNKNKRTRGILVF